MALADQIIPNLTGMIIDDRFMLLNRLGAGTYGVVYKALDTHAPEDPKYRAVKILSKAGRADLSDVYKEMALHDAVSSHPNVVTIHESYEDDHYFYIVLDFIAGGDLFDKIANKMIYAGNDDLLRTAFLGLLDAVQACHSAGIAHRDLKPENILASEDGSTLYLADFGLATLQQRIDRFGCGTSTYMAPECVAFLGEEPFNPHTTDIWSLGVILVNMMTGCHPWEAITMQDRQFRKFMENGVGSLYNSLPISEGAYRILHRIFTLDPRSRISLSQLRAAIITLDTFFRPSSTIQKYQTQYVPAPPYAAYNNVYYYCPHHELAAAGGLTTTTTTTTTTTCSTCSMSSGASSTESHFVVTPEGTGSVKPLLLVDIYPTFVIKGFTPGALVVPSVQVFHGSF